MYDGLDVRQVRDLGQYIYASGNPGPIHEFNSYINSQKGGGWLIARYQTVTDTHRQNTYATGGIMLLGGAILAGIGWGMNLPGQHLRRFVQYYNRALKQRGISWKLTPYSSVSNSGVGLVGRF